MQSLSGKIIVIGRFDVRWWEVKPYIHLQDNPALHSDGKGGNLEYIKQFIYFFSFLCIFQRKDVAPLPSICFCADHWILGVVQYSIVEVQLFFSFAETSFQPLIHWMIPSFTVLGLKEDTPRLIKS